MNKTLSEIITESALNILEQWEKDNPEDLDLSIAQQLNYSAVQLKDIGSKIENNYKRIFKGKITNDLH
jgi:hypothetical protein